MGKISGRVTDSVNNSFFLHLQQISFIQQLSNFSDNLLFKCHMHLTLRRPVYSSKDEFIWSLSQYYYSRKKESIEMSIKTQLFLEIRQARVDIFRNILCFLYSEQRLTFSKQIFLLLCN